MAFPGFAIRGVDNGDDRLVPLVTAGASSAVVGSDGDGTIDHLNAKELQVSHIGKTKLHEIAKAGDLSIQVAVTDSRVVFWCRKYDKGGGWIGGGIGGLAVAGVANAVSKARAAGRRKGNCLVGHARYTWLSDVGYSAKAGAISKRQTLRLVMVDGTEGQSRPTVAVDLALGSDVSARKVASEIARRTAAFRLRHHPTLTDEQRETLASIADRGISAGSTGTNFTLVNLPGGKIVHATTAFYDAAAPASEPETESSEEPEPVQLTIETEGLGDVARSVVEVLEREGSATFESIGLELQIDLQQVSNGVKELEGRQLVRRSRGGVYSLTQQGGVSGE